VAGRCSVRYSGRSAMLSTARMEGEWEWHNNPTMEAFESSLRCPMCGDFFSAACGVETCGHVFCSACVRSCLRVKSECPQCRNPVKATDLRPNRALERAAALFASARPGLLSAWNQKCAARSAVPPAQLPAPTNLGVSGRASASSRVMSSQRALFVMKWPSHPRHHRPQPRPRACRAAPLATPDFEQRLQHLTLKPALHCLTPPESPPSTCSAAPPGRRSSPRSQGRCCVC